MKIEKGMVNGDLKVSSDFKLQGMVTGSVVVSSGANFYLHGVVSANVTVSEGATTEIYGVVAGNVINNGGTLIIKGIVKGTVSGDAEIAPKAIVGKHT